MNCRKAKSNSPVHLILSAVTLVATAALTTSAPVLAMPAGDAPDLSVGVAQYPDDDAIILRWEQHWTLEADGTVHRRDHQWLKLLNSRPIRRAGDPRIDFAAGRDQLIIHTAQTHLPDGTVLPVPDYSFNLAGPDDVAGWPEYAEWQQMVVSFSGIEKDAVVELDYEIVTPAGVLPWIEGDLRIFDEYPIVQRVVTVTVPKGVTLNHRCTCPSLADGKHSEKQSKDANTNSWEFADLPGDRPEPQSPPWQERSDRLLFTTCPSPETWVSFMLDRVNQAGVANEAIKTFAESTVEDEAEPAQKVRLIAKKLHDSFNRLTCPKTMEPLTCRSAAEVFRANYGNPLESGALCLAALRSLGLDARAKVAVDAVVWDDRVPTGSAFAGVAIEVDLPDGLMYLHPEHTVLHNPGQWGRHWLLSVEPSGSLAKTYIAARGEAEPSELRITGKITVDAKGRATGDLRIRATGVFYDPAALDTAAAQKRLVGGFIGRVVSDVDVSSHSVVQLSDGVFRATAALESEDALKSLGGRHVLRLGDGPACLPGIPMPLERSYRSTDVRLAGRFRERIDVTIELPEGWAPSIIPATMAAVQGAWGTCSQTVEVQDNNIRFRRHLAVMSDTIAPDEFEKLRQAVNDLQATKSVLLAFGPSPESPEG